MSEHSQRSVKGATAIALHDIWVSAMSGKSLSDTSLFSLLLSGGLKLFVDVFQRENQYEPNPLWCPCETDTPKFRCAFDEVYLLKGPILSVCVCLGVLKAAACKAQKPYLTRLLKGLTIACVLRHMGETPTRYSQGVKTKKKASLATSENQRTFTKV